MKLTETKREILRVMLTDWDLQRERQKDLYSERLKGKVMHSETHLPMPMAMHLGTKMGLSLVMRTVKEKPMVRARQRPTERH